MRPEETLEGEDAPKDIRPDLGWQKRGGACMDITPD